MKMITVGGVTMNSPIILGAGVCKNAGMTPPFNRKDLPLGLMFSGSYTPDKSDGNTPHPLSHWIEALKTGLNSYGMPNDGFDEGYRKLIHMSEELVHPHGVSVAGFEPQHYVLGIEKFCSRQSKQVIVVQEQNFGCPNKHLKKTVPLSYDLPSMKETIILSAQAYERLPDEDRIPIWIKISPPIFPEDREMLADHGIDVSAVPVVSKSLIEETVDIIVTSGHYIRALVGFNTIPNCRFFENGKPVTGPNEGKAGLSGELLRNIALKHFSNYRNLLPQSIDMVHSGGILTGDHVVEALNNGAKAVQVTSLPYWFGPKSIADLVQSEVLQQHLLSMMEEA